MKTCLEVYQFMNCSENKPSFRAGDGSNSMVEGYSKVETMVSIFCAYVHVILDPSFLDKAFFFLFLYCFSYP